MATLTSLKHHKENLTTKHRELDKKIDHLFGSPMNDLKVQSLKKQKLVLKQEIAETDRMITNLEENA